MHRSDSRTVTATQAADCSGRSLSNRSHVEKSATLGRRPRINAARHHRRCRSLIDQLVVPDRGENGGV